MRQMLFAYLPSMAIVLAYAVFAAAYRAILGYEPPFGEVTIGTLGTVAIGRAGFVTYQQTQVMKEEVRTHATSSAGAPQPISTPPVV